MIRKKRKEGMGADGSKHGEDGEMEEGGRRKEVDRNKKGGEKMEREGTEILPGPLATNWLRPEVKNVLGK